MFNILFAGFLFTLNLGIIFSITVHPNFCESIITFSGDVGINNNSIRKEVCEKLGSLGIKFDNTANESIGTMTKLSAKNSKVLVWAIPTNEELLIAKDTYNLINR